MQAGRAARSSASVVIDQTLEISGCRYSAVAVAQHHGQHADGGHYTAWVIGKDKCTHYDDSSVSQTMWLPVAVSSGVVLVVYLAKPPAAPTAADDCAASHSRDVIVAQHPMARPIATAAEVCDSHRQFEDLVCASVVLATYSCDSGAST